jgi:hypothetical protein
MNEILEKLKESTRIYREAEKAANEYSNALRALANVCEDEEIKATYLVALEEVTGKPGFVEAVRATLRGSTNALSAMQIKEGIVVMKKMDLSGYSNPMASIHTTLRRMKDRGEVQEGINTRGEKVYRLALKERVALSDKWAAATGAKKNKPFYGE